MPRTKGSKNTPPADKFDIGAFQVEDAVLPDRTRNAGPSKFANNPMVATLRASWDERQKSLDANEDELRGGKQLTVPGSVAREATGYIRNAAVQLADEGIGCRIVYKWDRDKSSAMLSDVPQNETLVTILFSAKPRKGSGSGEDAADTDEATTAEQDAEDYAEVSG